MPTHNPLRWTLERAASEFGINPRTLASRIRRDGILAGADGKFSTSQIDKAVHGDLDDAKLRREQAEAEISELDAAQRRNEVIDTESVLRIWSNIIIAARRVILNSELPKEAIDAILNELASLKPTDLIPASKVGTGTDSPITGTVPTA